MQGLRFGSRRCIGVTHRLRGCIAASIAVAAVGPLACRDTEPPPVLFVDLGDEGRPLPPVASPWVDPTLKDGRADWQPFREPRLGAFDEDAPDAGDRHTEAQPADGSSGVESEIRAMLADYNAIAAEGKTDELLDFYVESQVKFAEALFAQQATFVSTMAEVRKLLAEKLPSETDRIDRVFDVLNEQAQERLDIGPITSVSDSWATGEMTGMPDGTQVRFVVVDDAWYVELPESFTAAALAQMPALLDLFDQARVRLDSGQVPAEQTLAGFEQISARLSSPGTLQSASALEMIAPQPDLSGALTPNSDTAATNGSAAPAREVAEVTPALLKTGADVFSSKACIKCHRAGGVGGPRGPDLTDQDWVHCDGSIEGILSVLRSGVPEDRLIDPKYPFAMNPATGYISDDATLLALAMYVHDLSK